MLGIPVRIVGDELLLILLSGVQVLCGNCCFRLNPLLNISASSYLVLLQMLRCFRSGSCFEYKWEKVYLTPELSVVVYFTSQFNTVYFTLQTIQNRSNNSSSGFGRRFATVTQFYLYLFNLFPLNL